jgi:glycerate kinase
MHILIAPNAFKNSLGAGAAAEAIEEGLKQSNLQCTTQCFPIGDGGDGTGSLITKACKGIFITETVHDPLGKLINALMGLIDDGQTAVIEMAAASGLNLLDEDELNPLQATSFGTGELIVKALDRGVKKILLCVGGSATVDGGCGILQALGVQFLNKEGNPLEGMPESLINLASINTSGLDKRIHECECVILCDVANPLLGEKGSANIFGPQKGATPAMVFQLEASLMQFNRIIKQSTGIDIGQLIHGGAAGGVAAGLHALLNARLVNGIDYFLDITGFDAALQNADLLITGEGSIDPQTLDGKAPYGVAMQAKKKNIPVFALAGKLPVQIPEELNSCFDKITGINEEPVDLTAAIKSTQKNLLRTGIRIGNNLQTGFLEIE